MLQLSQVWWLQRDSLWGSRDRADGALAGNCAWRGGVGDRENVAGQFHRKVSLVQRLLSHIAPYKDNSDSCHLWSLTMLQASCKVPPTEELVSQICMVSS